MTVDLNVNRAVGIRNKLSILPNNSVLGFVQTPISQAFFDVLRKYPSGDAHLYLPGIGVINGLTAGNYLDSAKTTPATLDGLIGAIKDASGSIDASQSNTNSKPTLRRGIVNLLTYSNDLTNAAWVLQGTANKSGQTLNTPNSNDSVYHLVTCASGTYTAGFILSGSGTCHIFGYNGTDGNLGYVQIALTATPTLYVTSYTATAANILIEFGRMGADTATSVTFGGAGLFTGTLSAAQILACGGIPLTTSAPASSAIGPYYAQYSGAQSMSLSAPLFQMSDDFYFATAAVQTGDNSGGLVSVDGPNAATAMIYMSSKSPMIYMNGGGTPLFKLCAAAIPLGVPFVTGAHKVGSLVTGRCEAIPTAPVSTSAVGGAALTTGYIGRNVIGGADLIGNTYASIYIKGALSASDVNICDRWLAMMQGRTL